MYIFVLFMESLECFGMEFFLKFLDSLDEIFVFIVELWFLRFLDIFWFLVYGVRVDFSLIFENLWKFFKYWERFVIFLCGKFLFLGVFRKFFIVVFVILLDCLIFLFCFLDFLILLLIFFWFKVGFTWI